MGCTSGFSLGPQNSELCHNRPTDAIHNGNGTWCGRWCDLVSGGQSVCLTIDYIDKAWQKRTGNDRIGGCFFDTNAHETRLQSAHAKTVFMSVAGRHMAYVSGMDLATKQWDMIGHEGALRDRYRKRQPSAGLDPLWTTGWADAGAFVDGQLATDVKTTTLECAPTNSTGTVCHPRGNGSATIRRDPTQSAGCADSPNIRGGCWSQLCVGW